LWNSVNSIVHPLNSMSLIQPHWSIKVTRVNAPLDTFCPLKQHSNPIYTAAVTWPDCWLETNPLCLLQTVGRWWEITFQSYRVSVQSLKN
jgi:hypothetical protein